MQLRNGAMNGFTWMMPNVWITWIVRLVLAGPFDYLVIAAESAHER